jgi:hypothetical protein
MLTKKTGWNCSGRDTDQNSTACLSTAVPPPKMAP